MILAVQGGPAPFRGTLRVPGDKSISHRAALFAALAQGTSDLQGFPDGADNRSTLSVLRALGVFVEEPAPGHLRVHGRGPAALRPPAAPLDCGNSGTTARLLAGLLAGAGLPAELTGDASLRRRPMARVAEPLQTLGAAVTAAGPGGTLPLRVAAAPLHAATVLLPVASAQLKSAVLLAALGAPGTTRVEEPGRSRDHTERMLRGMGAPLRCGPGWAELDGPCTALHPLALRIPGDPSSAAFFAVLAAARPGSRVALQDLLLNDTRIGFVEALRAMGASVEVRDRRQEAGEPVGTLLIRGGTLRGVILGASDVPALIDELPVLAVAMALAKGPSTLTGAAELRVKESDRIAAVVQGLQAMGAVAEERPDGFEIAGSSTLHGATIATHHDHRLVMAFAVAGALAQGTTRVEGAEAAAISYPSFAADLRALGCTVSSAAP